MRKHRTPSEENSPAYLLVLFLASYIVTLAARAAYDLLTYGKIG